MRRILPLLLCAGLAASASASGAPPDSTDAKPSSAYRAWSAALFYRYESLSGGRAAWQNWHVSARRRFDRGTIIVEALRTRRFDAWDEALAADGWLDLWRGAYVNVRLQAAQNPRLLPATEWYLEGYQGVGRWEFSGLFRQRAFAAETVRDFGLTAAVYVGNWYLRARAQWTPREGRTGGSQVFMARRYWTPPMEFVEVQAGRGRSVETVAEGPVLVLTQTYAVALRVQKFLTRNLGFTAGGSYSDDDFFTRRSLTLGLLTRW